MGICSSLSEPSDTVKFMGVMTDTMLELIGEIRMLRDPEERGKLLDIAHKGICSLPGR